MIVYIKNMVCHRCLLAVEAIAKQQNLPIISLSLGELHLATPLSEETFAQFRHDIEAIGFELIDDKRKRFVEQIKTIIISLVHQSEDMPRVNLSEHLVAQMHQDYSTISNTFSEIENITLEKFYIAQKIERVKELLIYDELTLKEISYRLNYSSVAHLSAQFKSVTGFTPTQFKQHKEHLRTSIDQLTHSNTP